jgi:hypothetical protein
LKYCGCGATMVAQEGSFVNWRHLRQLERLHQSGAMTESISSS